MVQQLLARSLQACHGLKAKQSLPSRHSARHKSQASVVLTAKAVPVTKEQLPLEPAESFKMQDLPEFAGNLDMCSLASTTTGLPMWTFACTDFSGKYSPTLLVRSDYELEHPYQGLVLQSGGLR